jgi:hypothetical protein
MKTYLILNQDYVENVIIADNDESASLAAINGRTFLHIEEVPLFNIIGKRYIGGEYVELVKEPTADI